MIFSGRTKMIENCNGHLSFCLNHMHSLLSKPQFCFGEPLILHCSQSGQSRNCRPDSPLWTSLGMQWIRSHLTMQGTWVLSLVWEDSTCRVCLHVCVHTHTHAHAHTVLSNSSILLPSLPPSSESHCLLAYCSAIFNLCFCSFFLVDF